MSVIYSFLTTYEIYSFSEWRGPGVQTFDLYHAVQTGQKAHLWKGVLLLLGLEPL